MITLTTGAPRDAVEGDVIEPKEQSYVARRLHCGPADVPAHEGPAVTELLGGHTKATIGGMASVLPHIKSGRLRALGTTGETRRFALPDVPTLAESGVPGFSSAPWRGLTAPTGFYGIVAPTGTPAPIVDRLNKEIKTIMASPEARKRFRDSGTEPCYLSTAEFGPFIEQEIAKWIYVAKEAHITLSD